MLRRLTLGEVQELITGKHSFVLNVIANWCPDCTEKQAPNLPLFVEQLDIVGLDVINLIVQEEKRVYMSRAHEDFVSMLGGHGFPRTVLYLDGKVVDANNVEILTKANLALLLEKFKVFIHPD
ncbi:MAG: periplasmic thioredoxin of cytochrome c-type biogenesis [Aestuariibacter sp.]